MYWTQGWHVCQPGGLVLGKVQVFLRRSCITRENWSPTRYGLFVRCSSALFFLNYHRRKINFATTGPFFTLHDERGPFWFCVCSSWSQNSRFFFNTVFYFSSFSKLFFSSKLKNSKLLCLRKSHWRVSFLALNFDLVSLDVILLILSIYIELWT